MKGLDYMDNRQIKSCGKCGVEISNMSVLTDGKTILKDVNLSVHCGEFMAIIGCNGAGKTTLLKAILNEIKYSGDIRFVDHCGCGVEHAHVGYVPQSFYFDKSSSVSVLDFMNSYHNPYPVFLGHKAKKRKNILEMLKKVECTHLIDRKLGELSGGEMQRIMLAFALNPVPDLLILDEPISGVDQRGMDLFYKLVADLRCEHHIAVLLVSHDFALVEKYATKAALIDGGIKLTGTPKEVFESKEFTSMFGEIRSRGDI